MGRGETIADIVNELLNRSRIGDEQRQSYEERIDRAVWRDRGEWLRALEEADWSEGNGAAE